MAGRGRRARADGLGDRPRARRAARSEMILSVYVDNHRAKALLRALRLRRVRQIHLHGRRPRRRRPPDEAGAVTRRGQSRPRARRRAARLSRAARRRVDRDLCRAQCRHRVGRRSRDHRGEPRAARSTRCCRARACVTLYQVHSADCVTRDRAVGRRLRPHADALVTDRPGLALGILTADCAPVLLADARGRRGRRGACRVEGRDRRRHRRDVAGDGSARRAARPHRRRDRPVHRARQL